MGGERGLLYECYCSRRDIQQAPRAPHAPEGAYPGTCRDLTGGAADVANVAERLVPADQVAAAGYAGALVYVSELRPGATFDFKPVTREYADALRALGLHVVSCYQYGKPGWPTPSDFTRGYDGGVADARRLFACTPRQEVRIPRRSSSASTRTSTPTPGKALRSNGFGASTRCWACSAPVFTATPGCVRGRSPTASSGNRPLRIPLGMADQSMVGWRTRTAAVLYQRVIVTASDPGISLGGTHVDEDDILAADFGQWDLSR